MSIVEREAVEVVTDAERRARVLEAAALEIDVRGWGQQNLCGDGGEVCLIGAIFEALGGTASVSYQDAVGTFGNVWCPCPENWNDAPDRTAEEVTFLLRWRAEEIRDGL